MIDGCDPHRRYLGALADGELTLVPPATADHVQRCERCVEEVVAHGLVSEKLRQALGGEVLAPPPARRRRFPGALVAPVAAAVLAAAAFAGVVTWGATRGDIVVQAAAATRGAPALYSTDAARIARWAGAQAKAPPLLHLPSLVPSGARVDSVSGTKVVTVYYTNVGDGRLSLTAGGGQVVVAWIPTLRAAPADTRIETRTVNGSQVLVVGTSHGTAVVSGTVAMPVLWGAAGALQQDSAASTPAL